MCNECEHKQTNQNKNDGRACPKCGIVSQFTGNMCLRCVHVDNYISYLSNSGSLI